jgi:hypothetical protein
MNELEQTKVALELLQNQKETFALLWGVVLTVGSVLCTVVGILFKLYIDANNRRADNEKEHLKSLQIFAEGTKDLNLTLKDTNNLVQKTLDLINNPIISTLYNLEKNIKD